MRQNSQRMVIWLPAATQVVVAANQAIWGSAFKC
jgi:hypothetical protein